MYPSSSGPFVDGRCQVLGTYRYSGSRVDNSFVRQPNRTVLILSLGSASCIIAALVLLIAAWATSYSPNSGAEKPKVTDWIQAWGSVGGVVAGLAAATAAALLLAFERDRATQAERQLAEERAEAAFNVARAVTVTGAGLGGYGVDVDPHVNSASFKIHNYGISPVRNVVAVVTLPTGELSVAASFDIIGPGDYQAVSKAFPEAVRMPSAWKFHKEKAPVTVCFTDFNDQAWQRTNAGEVRKIAVPYPIVVDARHSEDAGQT